jgi:flagellar biosynthesis/type III secretory pathway protein FliH
MAAGTCIRGAVAAALCVALAPGPAVVFAGQGEGNRGSAYAVPRKAEGKAGAPQVRPAYDNGFREGQRQGEVDAHGNRPADFAGHDLYRSANRGYDKALGTRDSYRNEFQRGFEAGYRQGYGSVRVVRDDRGDDRQQRWARGYREPATARGYSDGYGRGQSDGRDHDRYDPVRADDYRAGDKGYSRDYGSKDAYKNNYRSGFRQGYEDGYRDGARR